MKKILDAGGSRNPEGYIYWILAYAGMTKKGNYLICWFSGNSCYKNEIK
jgi:hypothetical protein